MRVGLLQCGEPCRHDRRLIHSFLTVCVSPDAPQHHSDFTLCATPVGKSSRVHPTSLEPEEHFLFMSADLHHVTFHVTPLQAAGCDQEEMGGDKRRRRWVETGGGGEDRNRQVEEETRGGGAWWRTRQEREEPGGGRDKRWRSEVEVGGGQDKRGRRWV